MTIDNEWMKPQDIQTKMNIGNFFIFFLLHIVIIQFAGAQQVAINSVGNPPVRCFGKWFPSKI